MFGLAKGVKWDEALTTPRAYLDHNATTPLHPVARAAMSAAFDVFGNPSSIHAEGRAARAILDEARRSVAQLTGCAPEGVIFTSCGTEALNIVLTPKLALDGKPFEHLLVGAGEHPAVLNGQRFRDKTTTIPLTADGTLNLEALREALVWQAGKRAILAIQAANNETGVIQPVREAADLVHAAGGFVVCDAIQAAGKIPCDIKAFDADVLTISAHKFGGPKGVGALCFGPSHHHLSSGVIRGGGQERGLSAGTENIIGIAGMGAACGPAGDRRVAEASRLERWRTAIERHIRDVVPEAVVFGAGAGRLPNTVCFAAPGLDAQVLQINLDLDGVSVSGGSACTSGKVAPSHVLTAMGVTPDLARSALRVSLGWSTREQDIEHFATAFAKAVTRIRPRIAA